MPFPPPPAPLPLTTPAPPVFTEEEAVGGRGGVRCPPPPLGLLPAPTQPPSPQGAPGLSERGSFAGEYFLCELKKLYYFKNNVINIRKIFRIISKIKHISLN